MSGDSSSEEELHDIEWGNFNPFFDYEDPFILSPQLIAVIQNDIKRLKALLKGGKSANVVDNYGNTPLHVSILKDKEKAFKYLMKVKDVIIDAINFDGVTPLMMALMCCRETFALKLIKKGADLSVVQNTGDTALHYSIGKSTTVCRKLIKKGADINCQNFSKGTPLFMACEKGACDFIRILLYYGADPMICDYSGTLPFHLTLRRCPLEIQEILFNYTFDEPGEMKLGVLQDAMVSKSPLFYPLLEIATSLVYENPDLCIFCQNLTHMEAAKFQMLVDKFAEFADDFFEACDPFMEFSDVLVLGATEIKCLIDMVYMLCDSPFIGKLVQKYRNDCFFLSSLINSGLPEDILQKVMCCLLSHGIGLLTEDLNMLYKCYGYSNLFKTLLHMEVVDYGSCCNDDYLGIFFLSSKIFNLNLTSSDFFKIRPDCVLKQCRQQVEQFFNTNPNSVPSLLELSREAARKHIIEKYKIKHNVQFYTVLKWLPINETYKSILAYELKIY